MRAAWTTNDAEGVFRWNFARHDCIDISGRSQANFRSLRRKSLTHLAPKLAAARLDEDGIAASRGNMRLGERDVAARVNEEPGGPAALLRVDQLHAAHSHVAAQLRAERGAREIAQRDALECNVR
jgi:hypothetical protein